MLLIDEMEGKFEDVHLAIFSSFMPWKNLPFGLSPASLSGKFSKQMLYLVPGLALKGYLAVSRETMATKFKNSLSFQISFFSFRN